MITSKEIEGFILKHWLEEHHCPYVCSRFKRNTEEMDVLAVSKSLIMTEFEIKVSRSDFFADFKKDKHRLYGQETAQISALALQSCIPNKFYFAVPNGLVNASEVPEWAGLIYFSKFGFSQEPGKLYVKFEYAKKAPYIHRMKADHSVIAGIAATLSARSILGCSLMTHKNREREKFFKTAVKRFGE